MLFHSIGRSGLQTDLSPDITPSEAFQLLVTNDILEYIVKETNQYAAQTLASDNLSMKQAKKHRLSKWIDTTVDEMKKFLGLLLWMGLVKYGSIEDYWSKSPLFSNEVASKVMPRNRFQLLLSCIHFNDNNAANNADRLTKIRPLIDHLQRNFQAHYIPGKCASLFSYSIRP